MTDPHGDLRPPPPEDLPRALDQPPLDHDERLIRWMLGLSPEDRIAVAQGFVDSVMEIRRGRRGPLPRNP